MLDKVKKFLYDIQISITSIEEYLGKECDFNKYQSNKMLKAYIQKRFNLDVDIAREKYLKPRYKKSILKETQYVE